MNKHLDRSFQESGFTFIELLIAVTILIFGLIALGTLSGNVVSRNAETEKRTIALSLAEAQIEELKRQRLNGALTVGTGTDAANPINGTYTRTWAIATNTTFPELQDISVTVAWPVGRSVVLNTTID